MALYKMSCVGIEIATTYRNSEQGIMSQTRIMRRLLQSHKALISVYSHEALKQPRTIARPRPKLSQSMSMVVLDKKNGVNIKKDQPKKDQRFKITTVLHNYKKKYLVVLFHQVVSKKSGRWAE